MLFTKSVCDHLILEVRTYIWTCEVRACDQKNGRNPPFENLFSFSTVQTEKNSWKNWRTKLVKGI